MKNCDYHFLNTLSLSSKKIEDDVANSDLQIKKLGNSDYVEKFVKLPLFAPLFYALIYKEDRIITQKEYIDAYIKHYKDYLNEKLRNNDDFYFLRSRLSRAYASLVRDIHFYFLIQESAQFEDVKFNVELDLIDKIDVLVQKNGKEFGIELMVKTKRADQFYNKKKSKHLNEEKIDYIKVQLNFKNTKVVQTDQDDLFLYNKSYVDYVLKTIKKTA